MMLFKKATRLLRSFSFSLLLAASQTPSAIRLPVDWALTRADVSIHCPASFIKKKTSLEKETTYL